MSIEIGGTNSTSLAPLEKTSVQAVKLPALENDAFINTQKKPESENINKGWIAAAAVAGVAALAVISHKAGWINKLRGVGEEAAHVAKRPEPTVVEAGENVASKAVNPTVETVKKDTNISISQKPIDRGSKIKTLEELQAEEATQQRRMDDFIILDELSHINSLDLLHHGGFPDVVDDVFAHDSHLTHFEEFPHHFEEVVPHDDVLGI